MKKKILALLLAAAATVSLLSGCGANSGNAVPARAAGGILLIVPLRGLFQGLELLHVMAEKQFRVMLRGLCAGRSCFPAPQQGGYHGADC